MSYTDDERIRAKRRALYILARRDHSAKELYDKLITNYPPKLCSDTVELMKEFGYIDDEKYCAKLYRRYVNKGWGKSRIRMELRRRGLSDALIAQSGEEYDGDDYTERIIDLLNTKYASKLDFDDYASVRRVTASLCGRGYSFEDIKRALAAVKQGELDIDEDE